MTLAVTLPDWDERSERLIAFLRLALAAGSLIVIWLDPTQPSRHWRIAYLAFVLYLVYSAVVFRMSRQQARSWLPIMTQAIDLLWVPPVLYFTEGANTPFFPFFVIFTLSAGVRWGLWGSWAVTIYSLVIYGSLLFIETPTPLDLNNDLMRLGYFLIVGVLGGNLAEYRRTREKELKTLQTVSEAIGARYETVSAVGVLVDIVRELVLADVVVAVLREPGERDILMVRGDRDVARLGENEAAPFFEAAAAPPSVRSARAVPLTDTAAVILRFAEAKTGLAYPIRAGDDLVGAIFCFVRAARTGRHASNEFLGLLLRHVIPQLETLYVLERTRHVDLLEERRRIARDLHDSFIQVLAALGLRLDALSATLATDPADGRLRKELGQMRDVITDELQRVRAYLAEMREPLSEIGNLRDLIDRTTRAFSLRTGTPVDVHVESGVAQVPAEILRELAPLVREALTNVEKHARAARVTVSAQLDGEQLTLAVVDDGVGIEAHDMGGSGPGQGLASMRDRARLLGGTFSVERPDSGGTRLAVSIPLPLPGGSPPLRG